MGEAERVSDRNDWGSWKLDRKHSLGQRSMTPIPSLSPEMEEAWKREMPRLLRRFGNRVRGDLAGYEEYLGIALWRALSRYDPAKAPFRQYCNMVAKRSLWSWLKCYYERDWLCLLRDYEDGGGESSTIFDEPRPDDPDPGSGPETFRTAFAIMVGILPFLTGFERESLVTFLDSGPWRGVDHRAGQAETAKSFWKRHTRNTVSKLEPFGKWETIHYKHLENGWARCKVKFRVLGHAVLLARGLSLLRGSPQDPVVMNGHAVHGPPVSRALILRIAKCFGIRDPWEGLG